MRLIKMHDLIQAENIQAIKDELAHILNSKEFNSSRRLRDFLIFLVEETLAGRGPEIKAYTIATQVFKRPSDFDPQNDSLVRVEAVKLRKRLKNYYRQNSASNIEITIPKGRYHPVFLTPKADTSANFSATQNTTAKPVIVVLPFTNLCSNDNEAHLVIGFVEEIVIGLTRFHDLNVINANFSNYFSSSNSSTPKQQDEQADLALAKKLGARFVLQGSLQIHGKILRIRLNLVDAHTCHSLWAERYDSNFDSSDFFSIFDEITNKILAAIGGSFGFINKSLLSELDHKRDDFQTTKEFAAYEAVLHYHSWIGTSDKAHTHVAREALEKAITVDPYYALPKGMLADIYAAISQWTDTISAGEELEQRSMQLALEGEKIAPSCQYCQWAKTFNYFLRKQSDDFIKAARFVLSLNQANTNIVNAVGYKLVIFGQIDEGMEILENSRKLNPFLPDWYHVAPALVHYMNNNLDAALNEANKLQLPGYLVGPLIRGAILGKMGLMLQAKQEIDEALAICPNITQTGRRTLSRLFFHDRQVNGLIQGLNLAGLAID